MVVGKRASTVLVGTVASALLAAPIPAVAHDFHDALIRPGETVTLDRSEAEVSLGTAVDKETELPAGWSVWSQGGTHRVSAPAQAQPGELAVVRILEGGRVVDEVRVTVEKQEEYAATKSTSWLQSLIGTLSVYFR